MENQEKEDLISRDEILNNIMKYWGQDGVASRRVLVGEAGIGKTWLAKEVSKRVTQETSSSYIVLWLHLNKKIVDEKTLYENLAAQLSLFFEYEEGENQNEVDVSLETLKTNIANEIRKRKKTNLVLILDDEGKMTSEKHVMDVLNLRKYLKDFLKDITLKTLVTRRGKIQREESNITIEVDALTETESKKLLSDSQSLLESYTVEDWPDLLKSLCEAKEIEDPTLMSCIVRKSQGLPAALVVLTKSLNSIKTTLSAKQRKIFKEVMLSSNALDAAAASKNAVDRSRYNPVLRLSYELLKPEGTVRRPVIACFWHVLDFYKYAGCAYYRDLIVHWMLEGYFDPVKSVEKAYQEGHDILMEFMKRGILKKQEDNMVVPEVSMSNLLDLEDCGFFGRSCLGFNRVYGGDKAKGLGRIIVVDDMIRTIQSKNEKITTLIVSGNRLRREVPNKFFEKMQDLEVVVLFDPTFQDLVQSLSNLTKLRVLVIRDCDLIENIDELKGLVKLQVLEVSGASYLDNITDDFFKDMTDHLQSLNLSGLSIKSPPSTIENLNKLRCFILRDCPNLQDLPNFNVATKELEVIDIHGARDLKSYFDRVKDWKDYKGKNKNFAHLRNLEHLDFSGTQIIRLPIFHTKDYSTMPALTRLLVRNCLELKRLPQLRPLTKLQVLDISGCKKLVEMLEVCLEEKEELRILNISKTALPELADTINDVVNLNQLLVRNCSQMKELPNIEMLTHLEVFDVSGSNQLAKIDGTFGKMSYLHKVNLSGTDLSGLPKEMSELANIKELIMRNCAKIESLPNLEKMLHLEIFDVSGCSELKKIEGSFENMSYLCEVNLSGTKLKTFPELPKKQSILRSSKRIVLADSKFLKSDEWSEIKELLAKDPEGSSFHSLPDKSGEEREKPVHHGERYRVLDPEDPEDINIIDTNRPVGDDISKAEYVSVSDNESENVSLVLDKFKMSSVKGCWVERCKKMETLFVSSPESLEILWISNLPLLKTLGNEGAVFMNLKKLTIDCCRNIETLFQGASQLPVNLEVLRVMFCDQLKKLFDGVEEAGELPRLRKLYLLDLPVLSSDGVKFPSLVEYTTEKCPGFTVSSEVLKMGTKKTEEGSSSKDQPHEDTAPEIQTTAESAKTTGTVQTQDKSSPV